MTSNKFPTGKAALASAIGSAAIAAAVLFVTKRKIRSDKPGPIPSGENPETD